MASSIPGRTPTQIREKWGTQLNLSISNKSWTTEEDFKLVELVAKHGNKWSEIRKSIPGRTDAMCMNRYRKLTIHVRNSMEAFDGRVLPEHLVKYGCPHYTMSRLRTREKRNGIVFRVCEVIKEMFPREEILEASTDENCLDMLTPEELDELIARLESYAASDAVEEEMERCNTESGKKTKGIGTKRKLPAMPRMPPLPKKKQQELQTAQQRLEATEHERIDESLLRFVMPAVRPRDYTGRTRDTVSNKIIQDNLKLLEVNSEPNPKEIAPLPPTRVTISAFRQLLLQRRQLESQAQAGFSQYVCPFGGNLQGESSTKGGKPMPKRTCRLNKKRLSKKQVREQLAQQTLDSAGSFYTGKPEACLLGSKEKVLPKTVTQSQQYKLLQARFQAAFLWPALLSKVDVKVDESYKEEEELESGEESGPPKKSRRKDINPRYVRKKSVRKPWVTEALKKRHEKEGHGIKEKTTRVKRAPRLRKPVEKVLEPTRRSGRIKVQKEPVPVVPDRPETPPDQILPTVSTNGDDDMTESDVIHLAQSCVELIEANMCQEEVLVSEPSKIEEKPKSEN